jgi:hypothetical protein
LRHDAEVAEDTAIRFADAHSGLHSGHFESMAEYGRVRDQRMTELFKTVAAQHGVSEEQVRESLTQRPIGLDFLAMLTFAAFYACVVVMIVRRSSMIMNAYLSVVLAAGGAVLGEAWTVMIESIRLDTGHLSYRTERIPWGHHRVALFITALALYWSIAIIQRQRLSEVGPIRKFSLFEP